MRIAIAQMNPTLGAFSENREKIQTFVKRAKEKHCSLVVFPEAVLFGYHPFDFLERPQFVDDQLKQLARLHASLPEGITVVLGLFTRNPHIKGRPYFNSAAVLEKGKKAKFFHKELLPSGDVFDESRFIESGSMKKNFFLVKGQRVFLTICEDIWAWGGGTVRNTYKANPIQKIKGKKVDLVLNISASPYYPGKEKKRLELVQKTARHFKAPMIYVNLCGGQDEIIFDGASFAVDKKGRKLFQCVKFDEDLNVLDLEKHEGGFRPQALSKAEELRQALVLGLRDFCRKTGMSRVHVGLSGGIDSSLVGCLAVDALGAAQVTGVGLPGPFNAPESLELARSLAKNLGIQFLEMPIGAIYDEIRKLVETTLHLSGFSVVHENLQARIRGLLLMAYANHNQSLLLTTSNKSEYATGYATLYGDMCGGLAPIGDLTKEQVYLLSELYNQQWEVIPKRVIERAPSAELRPNQRDEDSLPPYAELDKSIVKIVEQARPAQTGVERWLLSALIKTEFKRWQAPPILKVSRHAFGRGRRWPIAVSAN